MQYHPFAMRSDRRSPKHTSSDSSNSKTTSPQSSMSSRRRPDTPRSSAPASTERPQRDVPTQTQPLPNSYDQQSQIINGTVATLPTTEAAVQGDAPIDLNNHFTELSDELPSREAMQKAGDVPIYDSSGNARLFKTLFTGVENMGQRQLIIFVRHFYCSACKGYMKALLRTITPSAYFALPKPTRITIIGCGSPNLIATYATQTSCPFPIYAEPSRKLYKALGMSWTLQWGKQPEYCADSKTKITVESLGTQLKAGYPEIFQGGNLVQIGGEFLFEEGTLRWCHRMHRIRDHSEMTVVRKLLEMEDGEDDVEIAYGDDGRPSIESLPPTAKTRKLKLVREKDGIKTRPDRASRAEGT